MNVSASDVVAYEPVAGAFTAALWGLGSAISLVLGAIIGTIKQPGRNLGAAILAFGGGALVEALSVELFGHILHMQETEGIRVVLVAIAAAVFGGIFFFSLGKLLDGKGGYVGSAHAMRLTIRSLRRSWRRRLVKRLQLVPMLHGLSEADLTELAGLMHRTTYRQDQQIYARNEDGNVALYFILHGSVRVTLFGFGEAPKAARAAVSGAPADENSGHSLDDVLTIDLPDGPTPSTAEGTAPAAEPPPAEHFELTKEMTFGDVQLLTGLPSLSQAVALGDATTGGRTKLLTLERADLDRWLAGNPRAASALRDHERRTAAPPQQQLAMDAEGPPSPASSKTPTVIERIASSGSRVLKRRMSHEGSPHNSYGPSPQASPMARAVSGGFFPSSPMARAQNAELSPTQNGSAAAAVTAFNLDELDSLERSRRGYPTLSDYGWRRCAGGTTPPELGNPARPTFLQSIGKTGSNTSLAMQSAVKGAANTSLAVLKKASSSVHGGGGGATKDPLALANKASDPAILDRARLHNMLDQLRDDDDLMTGYLHDDETSEVKLLEEHIMETGQDPKSDRQAAFMIWLGILIDAVPESFCLGILANGGDTASLVTFTCGVFLANFPEALSSAAIMHACGLKRRTILLMWCVIWLGTGLGAALGAVAFPPLSADEEAGDSRVLIVAAIEGMCGGAMLTMIASSVLPEAFEQSHDASGLSCTLGFLCALVIKAVGTELQRDEPLGH